METKRKLQVGATAVIANGLLALSLMTPRPAFANPCAAQIVCAVCQTLAYCQSIAKPGCTATSVTCPTNQPICKPTGVYTYCQYQ